MINIPLLQESHAIITTADFLLLQDLPADLETSKGDWSPLYHSTLSTYVIPNADFDYHVSRVDRLPEGFQKPKYAQKTEGLGKQVRELFTEEGKVVDLNEIVDKVKGLKGRSDEEIESLLSDAGAWVLRTWQGSFVTPSFRLVQKPSLIS